MTSESAGALPGTAKLTLRQTRKGSRRSYSRALWVNMFAAECGQK